MLAVCLIWRRHVCAAFNDGITAGCPFAALPGRDPGKYLIEEVALAIIPVPGQLVAERHEEPTLAERALIIGGIDFDSLSASPGPSLVASSTLPDGGGLRRMAVRTNGAMQFTPLPGTASESETIAQLYLRFHPQAVVHSLRGAQASETEVRKLAPEVRYLHLATHGFFADSGGPNVESAHDQFREQVTGYHPALLTGLALAGANRIPTQLIPTLDDGILTGLEIAQFDLRRLELAVLSACETSLGRVAYGEGMLGLQRAFQVAGAKTVVASLWKVPDEPTRILMERFYSNLWSRERPFAKLDALIEAQRWMIQQGARHERIQRELNSRGLVAVDVTATSDTRLPPYYWAAFVLSGDWR